MFGEEHRLKRDRLFEMQSEEEVDVFCIAVAGVKSTTILALSMHTRMNLFQKGTPKEIPDITAKALT